MDLDKLFTQSAENVTKLKTKPDDDALLKLYGLYKQATVGVCNTEQPSYYWDAKGYYKWEAWNNCKSKTKDVAKQEYINLVKSLMSK